MSYTLPQVMRVFFLYLLKCFTSSCFPLKSRIQSELILYMLLSIVFSSGSFSFFFGLLMSNCCGTNLFSFFSRVICVSLSQINWSSQQAVLGILITCFQRETKDAKYTTQDRRTKRKLEDRCQQASGLPLKLQ